MLKKAVLLVIALTFLTGTAWAKKIVIASDATWPPMEFVDAEKNIVGFDIDYMKAAAELGGYEIEIKNVAWDGIFAGLDAGKYDAVCSSVSITDERKKTMDFSTPYFKVRQALIVAKDSPEGCIEALKGKTVGAQIGTTGYFMAKKADGVESKSYDEVGLAVEDLYNGRIAGVLCDDPTAANYALQDDKYKEKLKIACIVETSEEEFYGVAVKKGNKEVLDQLNKGIKMVQEKGLDKEFIKKWIGQ